MTPDLFLSAIRDSTGIGVGVLIPFLLIYLLSQNLKEVDNMISNYIKFIFSNEGVNIPNLVVYFILNVKNKNDYTIGPLITNDKGEITLTKGQVESVINQYNMDSPMDYAGSLDSCIGIDVLVESYEELSNRLLALQEFYPQNALSLKNAIKVCMNKNYRIYRKIKFPIIDRNVFVNVEDG